MSIRDELLKDIQTQRRKSKSKKKAGTIRQQCLTCGHWLGPAHKACPTCGRYICNVCTRHKCRNTSSYGGWST